VPVEIEATGICLTDEFTLSEADLERLFPAILGHEGGGGVAGIGSNPSATHGPTLPLARRAIRGNRPPKECS
jgi:Zn-dependent alcohol dehydrogenase